MKEQIEKSIKDVLKNLGIKEDINFSVEHPEDFKNGDYSTNVAMVYAKSLKTNPKELAEKIITQIKDNLLPTLPLDKGEVKGGGLISDIQIAGPGFINFYLSREFFTESVNEILEKGENWGKNNLGEGKKTMVEYTDPNPFKPFHIGHLMTNAIGESISRIVEFSGSKTIRANYQGDAGPHVAKAIYILMQKSLLESKNVSEIAQYIGKCYSEGSNLYDTDESVKKEIDEINKKIYERSDEKINEIYDWGRKVTLEAFEEIYKILGTKFDHYFFESEMASIGEKIVRENVGKVFEESDGAIIFHGEKYDSKLHTRVFINSQGLPTYEAKEIGLALTKFEKEKLDSSMVITAIEQAEYMKVVMKAISLMHKDIGEKMKHISHGMMKLTSGKMSSRKGNIITGESLLRDSMKMVEDKMNESDISVAEKKIISEMVGVSALKYSILKSSLGSDIIYDQEKSISFDGDSGPYLQYTAVRANSILEKAKTFKNEGSEKPEEITDLEKILYTFPEVVEKSYNLLEPHHIATYLTQLASEFNTFYGNTKILDYDNKYIDHHLNLVKAFYQTMENGLWLLGIKVPEKM